MISTRVSNLHHQLLQKDTFGIIKAMTELASPLSFSLLLSSLQCLISWQPDKLDHYVLFRSYHWFVFHTILKYLLACTFHKEFPALPPDLIMLTFLKEVKSKSPLQDYFEGLGHRLGPCSQVYDNNLLRHWTPKQSKVQHWRKIKKWHLIRGTGNMTKKKCYHTA
jgi:hypothetical protein